MRLLRTRTGKRTRRPTTVGHAGVPTGNYKLAGMAGVGGLGKAGRAGRKPRLSGHDLWKIGEGLKRGSEALGRVSGLWTSSRVAELIERDCGVKYRTGHVWWLLWKLGWSLQGGVGHAWEHDLGKICP